MNPLDLLTAPLGAVLVFAVAVIAWVGSLSMITFLSLESCGVLRCKETLGVDDVDMDASLHAGMMCALHAIVPCTR